jgi:phosphoglycolate phosphatase
MTPHRYCLFDLDGTLTNPETGIVRSMQHGLSATGLPEVDHAILRSSIGPPLQDVFARLGVEDVDAAVVAYRERFVDVGMYENEVIPGMPAVLDALVADGWTLAVATSKPAVFAEKILKHFQLDGFFAYVAGATLDGSRRHKADVIRHALDVLGAPAEATIMVGDRREDVAGAAECHVRSVAVRWGFGVPGEFAAPEVISVVDTPGDLLAVLRETARTATPPAQPADRLSAQANTDAVTGPGDYGAPGSLTRVLADVTAERVAQDARWGVREHPDGTGPELRPEADRARQAVEDAAARGLPSWRDILYEEVMEAFAEDDPERLRAELIQVAAVAVKWVQALDQRVRPATSLT